MQIRKVAYFILISMLFIGLNMQTVLAYHHEDYGNFKEQYEKLNDKQKKEVNEIITSLHQNLNKLGVHVPPMHFIEKEQKKEQIKKLIRDVANDKITAKEAEKKLNSLFEYKGNKHKKLEHLDEKAKREAQIIFDLMKSGQISKEEGRKQLKDLGIELPKELDEKTKKQAKKYIEDANKKLKKYKINLPADMYKHCLNK